LKEWLTSSIALETTPYIQSWIAQMVETNPLPVQATKNPQQDKIIKTLIALTSSGRTITIPTSISCEVDISCEGRAIRDSLRIVKKQNFLVPHHTNRWMVRDM
jgi:hypothetical protein